MKELSIEEKAKRYDKLFVKASRIYNKENDVLILHTIEDLFPELCESEDEKIRKALITFFQRFPYEGIEAAGTNVKDALAWLEKQGKEDSSIQQAYEWGYTEGKRIERKHWVEKQKFSEDYNSIDPQFGKPIEQNPAWSEKDEKEYKYVLKFVDNILNNCGNKKDYDHCKRCYDWLKSLRQRIGG